MSEHRRADYGFDQPMVPIGLAFGGISALAPAGLAAALNWGTWTVAWLALSGFATLVGAGWYVYVTRRGKHAVWAQLLEAMSWKGDERVLDMGCGRGMVLLAAARHLPRGTAVGVDIWAAADQSGNDIAATRRNAAIEGLAERVQVETADIRKLPFPDASFDVVLSSLVLHNIHSANDRKQALAEAVRVLRPGGRLMIADILHVGEYRRALQALGMSQLSVRELGVRMWYGNPVVRTRLVSGVAPT